MTPYDQNPHGVPSMQDQTDPTATPNANGTSRRGFASMDRSRQKEIASAGGRAAHQRGTAHKFTTEEAREAGRKGGEAISRNREHMASIGRKGGEARGGGRRGDANKPGFEQ